MSTYEWNCFTRYDQGNINAPGFLGTPFSPGALVAPTADSKLVRVALGLYYEFANTNPSVLISPDWMAVTTAMACVDVQAAGDSTVPNPTDANPTGRKVRAFLHGGFQSFGFSSSQGISIMQTDQLVWSQGEDRTPPGGGLQVRPGFILNNAASGPGIFGSSARWHYAIQVHALWLHS